MRLARILLTALVIVALLSTLVLSAYAAGQGYGRENNPGQGHDWNPDAKGNNNADDNTHHSDNGYQNHSPGDSDGGGPT